MLPQRLSHFKGLPEQFDSCLYGAGERESQRERGESVQQWQWSQTDTLTDSREKRERLQSFKGLRK